MVFTMENTVDLLIYLPKKMAAGIFWSDADGSSGSKPKWEKGKEWAQKRNL